MENIFRIYDIEPFMFTDINFCQSLLKQNKQIYELHLMYILKLIFFVRNEVIVTQK
jgi:hypothetical protein